MENNTFTIDTTPPTETLSDNLTSDEVDSLKVGEELAEQQDSLLAGKYKSAEELEKAYKELEAKLGDQESETETEETESEPEETESEPEETEESSLSETAQLITSASDEYYANDRKISPETMDKFKSLSSEELLDAFVEYSKHTESEEEASTASDLTESQINSVKSSVGGDEAYTNIVKWASTNLDTQSIEAFDTIMSEGNIGAIQLAVNGLKSQYEQANGYEGKMYTGKAPTSTKDTFRSQAELVAAMNDKRYDKDPAYRQDVIAKLDRSDLNF